MRCKKITLFLLLLLGATDLAYAQATWRATDRASIMLADAARGRTSDGLLRAIALGYVGSSGNADNKNLNAKASLGYVSGAWRHAAMIGGLYGSGAGTTTVQQYEFAEQSDFTMARGRYLFGSFNYNADRFGTTRSRASEVFGYGMRMLDTAEHIFDLQLGVGTRQSRFSDDTARNEGIVSFGASYVWRMSEHADVSEQFTLEHGETNTFGESITEVRSTLRSNLGLSMSYIVRHNSEVPVGTVKTDSTTLISLIYSF